jgi:hypothetical protein
MERIAVVIQPTYLPWLGYFDLIDQSSAFVFLDNVQLEKRSWQQRNQIRTAKGLEWLSIPVQVKGRFDQLIKNAEIMSSNSFPQDHLRSVELNYGRAPFFEKYYPQFHKVMTKPTSSLCELNIGLIRWFCTVMGLQPCFEASSQLGAQGKRSALLADVCQKVGADVYLSPSGSKEYLVSEHREFSSRKIKVLLHQYEHPEYRQLYSPFIPYASILDLIFNEGERSLEIVRSGRRKSSVLLD